jgi:hypothetical protein
MDPPLTLQTMNRITRRTSYDDLIGRTVRDETRAKLVVLGRSRLVGRRDQRRVWVVGFRRNRQPISFHTLGVQVSAYLPGR